jgi:signal transduction histidine kinase
VIRSADAAAQFEIARFPGLHPMIHIEGAPPPAVADPGALAHALRNLITNIASRASGPVDLDVTIDAVDDRVRCRLQDLTDSLVDHDLPGFFDLPEADPRPGMIGPGIAVYVAGALVRAMRGYVWADRTDSGAIEIGLSLPRYEAA